MDADGRLVGMVCHFECTVEGAQKGGAPGDAQGGVLALPHERTEFREGHGLFTQQVLGLPAEGFDLPGREFNGAMQAIKDPAENLLAGVPDTFFV